MGFFTRLIAGLVAASTLGAGLAGTAGAVDTTGAASDTTGAVTTTADDTGGRTVLDCRQSGEGATGPYADKFCWIDWSNLPLDSSGKPTPVRINVPGGHIDADATITHTDNAALTAKDYTGSKWSRLTSAYKLTGNTALAFSGRMGRQDPAASVTFSNVTPSADRTDTGVNVLKDFQLAFGDAEVMSGGVLQGHDVYERTDIESDKTLEKLGMIGSGDPNQSYSKANTGYGTTHVTLAGGPKGATDDANKDSKGAAVVGAKQASRFKVSFGQVNQHWDGWGSAIAVGVYMPYLTAYPLTYDKNASDATGEVPSNQRGKENTVQPAKAKTTGTVKTVADDDSSKSLTVNPGFNVPDYSKLNDGGLHWMYVNPAEGKAWSYYDYINPAHPNHQVAGLSQATFGWQELTGGDYKTTLFELHREKDGNVCADVHGSRTIGQTIDTQAGVAYTVSIRHSGRSKGNAGSVQVLVGPDKDHLRPLEMSRMNVSRTGAKYGDRIGKVGTVITTHSDSVDSTEGDHPAWDHSDDWETYSGTYVATGGKTVFAYRGVDKNGNAVSGTDSGADSVIDDMHFQLAYPLSYDKNSDDATGSVPSNQRGKENTVQPAKAKTTGSVRLAADKTASGLTVHDLEMNDVPADYRQFILSTTDTRLSQVEFEDGAWYKSTDPSSQGMWPLRIGSSLTIPSVGDWTDPSGKTHQISMTMRLKDWNGGSVSELYRFDGHGNIVGDGRFWINTAYGSGYSSLPAKVKAAMGGVDTSKRVGCSWTVEFTYADTGEKVPDTFKGVTGFNDLDGWDAQSDLKFEGVQLLSGFDGAYKRSDAELGTYGTNGFAGIKHVAGDEAHLNAPQQSRHRLAATWTGSTFTFSYDLSNPAGRTDGSRMTFGAPVTRTAVLTYDKNAADASGQVPSNTTPDTTQTASSKSTGKVSDLVQRTTTHEDGSVTVKTIDTSTDVVSGCQVYYPAGQKITLATLAKDDDCWDSSMLSRPGHTQLGWNQDRNATAAQPEVTMVEGGMTVYAVWVGNPVLTYDTNKPNTWNGQMPSTPASVSVPYDTAAADGSGWQSGDTSKIRGYRFLGWYAGPQDDSGLYDWNTLLTGNVTVYAHWQRLQANVVYDANGGTGSHGTTAGWQYSDVTVPSDTSKSFTRAGYVFLGWDTQADGNGTAYKDGSQVPLQDKDITLYAQWQPVFEQFTPTGGVSLPLLVAGGVTLLVMGIGSTVMLTRRMRGER